jgi:potassium voltage-gated channel Eag-related subfamily H protein 5
MFTDSELPSNYLIFIQQDGEILAFLGKGDVFGDSGWRDNTVTKSAVHVRALTYCDIHMINVQKLKEILEFYKAFAQTFARNLVLTFDLSKRTVFYRIADKHLEKLLAEDSDPRTMFTASQVSQMLRNLSKIVQIVSN